MVSADAVRRADAPPSRTHAARRMLYGARVPTLSRPSAPPVGANDAADPPSAHRHRSPVAAGTMAASSGAGR